ncbi:tetratricopeptide repeat protein [Neisseria montereyensis]|uniref:Tetratricopeptide repeat protein n=1 Tax=Neisseria montereyensis TaxID=2973938 RepID=A0ABT2FBZ1_9NEIS|nr:tetratricopeptide repeat protein [Neisseria montereyensis]MCS4533642.1 tetratricopeptide repeat protein [Neisseria montereyensis]
MNIRIPALLTGILILNACANITPDTAPRPIEDVSADNAIPYPEPDMQSQIHQLGVEITRLEQHIETLETRIRQLERRPVSSRSTRSPQPLAAASDMTANSPSASEESAPPSSNTYSEALKKYRSGNYAAAAELLKGADSGGSGSDNDRNSMYLLMQSHQRLGNCESVINIGRRFAVRFRSTNQAAEALFSVGSCQYQMQQQDIARDTWRKLIHSYPDSPAAKRAYARLQKRR